MTTTDAADRVAPSSDASTLLRALSSPRRRRALRIVVRASPAGLEREAIASRLATVIADERVGPLTDEDRRRVRIELVHRDLPALVEAGLLETAADGTVTAADHSLLEDGASGVDREALVDSVSASRRWTLLSTLREADDGVSSRSLARLVAAREEKVPVGNVASDRVETVRTSLVHVHLPALAETALLTYDPATDRVAVQDRSLLGEDLLALLGIDRGTADGCDLAAAET